MPTQKRAQLTAAHRTLLASLVVCSLAGSSIAAQDDRLSTVVAQTGLMTYFAGINRFVGVTVSDVAPRTVTSTVRIAFYDSADRLLLKHEGVLRRGEPVQADLPLNMLEVRTQVRVAITIQGLAGRLSMPFVEVAGIDMGSFTLDPRVHCGLPQDKPEGGTPPLCPELIITTAGTGG